MKLTDTFFVFVNTTNGQLLKEAKAAGFPRPALYASVKAANRAMSQRTETNWTTIENPDYDPDVKYDRTRTNEPGYYKWYYDHSSKFKQVRAAEGTWVIKAVTLQEVL